MSTDDRDDLVGDVADALTLDQQVPWERCARLATGADREQIENLRVIERVLASRPAAGPASETVPATRLSGSAVVRHAVHALIAIASLEVAATLLLLPWAWGDFSRAHGEVAVFMTTKLVGFSAGAGLLLWAGRGDWRTWLLGVYCLLKATNEPLYMLQAFVLELPPPPAHAAFFQQLPAANLVFTALYVPAFLFAPAFLWAFARECPRVHRRTWHDDLARRMIPTSVLIGSGLWLACAVTLGLGAARDELQVERVTLRIQASPEPPHAAAADFDLVRLVGGAEVGRDRWTLSLQFTFIDVVQPELMIVNPMGIIITYLRGDRALVTG